MAELQTTPGDGILLNETQTAQLLGVGRHYLGRLRKAGTGPRWVDLGSRKLIRYRPADVEAWLQERTRVGVGPVPDAALVDSAPGIGEPR